MNKFIFLEHTSDVKFQAFGKTIEEMFENSFFALKQSICGKSKIKTSKEKLIKVQGKDYETLLYNFLEEIIYFLEADNFICGEVKDIKIVGFKMSANLRGDKLSNYNFTDNIKAVTYHDMFVKKDKEKNQWVCQVLLDA
jgi:SHS2 domain-containing protein